MFQLNDQGHYAEALMTKGVLAPRGCMEQLKVCTCASTQDFGTYRIQLNFDGSNSSGRSVQV